MRIAHLSLSSWRNYAYSEIPLASGATLLLGGNGQGKTNLIEAVGYLATLSSHRVSEDAALIRQGADAAVVRSRLEHGTRAVTVELQLNRRAPNKAQLNGVPIKPRELVRHVAAVQFAPEDIALVRGDPAGRRRFLDELLVQQTPRLAGVTADYERSLRQRNSLLKSARSLRASARELSTLDVWDERLVALGSELIVARLALIADLAEPLAIAYGAVAGERQAAGMLPRLSILGALPEDEVMPELDPAQPLPDRTAVAAAFRSALARSRRAELERGVTLVGPHRDDLVLDLNGLPARSYASHGESWSFALALRLASAALLRARSPLGDPVIILDDVFAELDERRRDRLASAVAGFEQLLVTAAVESDVPEGLADHRLRVSAGTVEEVS